MKFTQTDISHLNNILNICSLVDIDAVIISAKGLRGVNAARSCAFLTDKNLPQIEGEAQLGLSKLRTLKQRMDLFKTDPKISIDAKQKPNGDFSNLDIKGSNASVQFRTAVANSIKAPVAIEDTARKSIIITREEAQLILNAEKAMGAEKITINVKKNNDVVVEFSDKSNDVFSVALVNKATSVGDDNDAFVNYYFTDVFSPVLRAAAAERPEVEVMVFEGSAIIDVNGYPLTLLSPMDID